MVVLGSVVAVINREDDDGVTEVVSVVIVATGVVDETNEVVALHHLVFRFSDVD